MSKSVQRRRGTTTEIAAFTGAEGEIIYDTLAKTLVVEDGVTQGGIYLARKDDKPATATLADRSTLAGSLATPVNISFSGDVTGQISAFDGKADSTAELTLKDSGVTPGTYNSLTVGKNGVVTAATNVTNTGGSSAWNRFTSTNKDFMYFGNGDGVVCTYSGNTAKVVIPTGVLVKTMIFNFTAAQMAGVTSMNIDYDSTMTFSGETVSVDGGAIFNYPTVTGLQDNGEVLIRQVTIPTQYYNGHSVTCSGFTVGLPYMLKFQF